MWVRYAASLSGGATVTLAAATLGLPAGLIPVDETPLNAYGSGTQSATARTSVAGEVIIRNTHSSSVTVIIVHGVFSKPA